MHRGGRVTKSERRIAVIDRGMTAAVILAVATLLTLPPPAHGFPWSVDMFRSPAVGPLTSTPRNQPAGTLSESGVAPLSPEVAGNELHNPLHPTPTIFKNGQVLFETYCTPCHGDNARGFGPVRYLLRVPPADLTHGMPVALSDGYIYSTIRNGNQAMPPYGDAMSSNATWALVLYVRELQHRANARVSAR